MGRQWRELIGGELRSAGLQPRIVVDSPYIESLLWRNGDRYMLAVTENEEGEAQKAAMQIRIHLSLPATNIVNVRTGKLFGNGSSIIDSLNPWEANLYSFSMPK